MNVFSATVLKGCSALILFVCAPQSHAQEIKELPLGAAISDKQPAIYWHDKDAQFDLDASANQWSIVIRQSDSPPTRVQLPGYINKVYSIRRAAANHLVVLAESGGGAYYVGVFSAATSSVLDEFSTSAAPGISLDNRYIILVRLYPMHGAGGYDDQYRLYDVLSNRAANWPHRPAKPAPEGEPENYDDSLAGVAVYPLDPAVRERDNTFVAEGLEHKLASRFVWDQESRRVIFADYSSGVLSLIMVAAPSGGERYPETSVYQVPANRNPCAEACLQKNIGKLEWLGNSVRVQLTTTPKNAPNRTSTLSVVVSSFIPARR
jgi:hypothetical protein